MPAPAKNYSRGVPQPPSSSAVATTTVATSAALGFPIEIGELTMTECQMISTVTGSPGTAPQFGRGYGVTFGHCERKAMSMAIVDRALRDAAAGEASAWRQSARPGGSPGAARDAVARAHCGTVGGKAIAC